MGNIKYFLPINAIMHILSRFNLSIAREKPRPSIKFIKKLNKNKDKNGLVGVEIGVYKGENAENILKTLPIEKLYLIDSYALYGGYEHQANLQEPLDYAERETRKRLRKFINKKVILIKEMSSKALKDIPNNLDFVYIDGNHDYEFVKEDMKNYYKKLKVGGVLAGHDIENGLYKEHDGVVKAFIEFVLENNLKPYILKSDWWVVKGETFSFKKNYEMLEIIEGIRA